jgi:two-component system OmpR family sensor kinase
MSQSHQPSQQEPATTARPEEFFREIEIQFLIHELKDPISIIETGLRTLLEKKEKFGPLAPKQENTLKRTLRNAKKAREMLNNLLEIGRSESGCFICSHFEPAASVYQAMKDSLEIMTGPLSDEIGKYQSPKEALELLTRNGICLEFTPEILDTEIFQDEIKFRQIVGNLLKNALHHRRQKLEVKMDLQGDMVSLTVADDGPGVDPDHHELIFKRYAQVKECSIVPRKGHGLGLAGALILAQCLGGDIKIVSEKGQGAAFCLTVPVSMEMVD